MDNRKLERFVVELEWAEHFEDLTNEEMGILFKNFISHAKGEEVDLSNRFVSIAWKSVVKQINRMNAKYMKDVENGKKGGRPRKPNNNPTETPNKPNNNPTETYKDKDEYKEEYKEEYKVKEEVKVKENISNNNIITFTNEEFGKLNHKSYMETFNKLLKGTKIIVGSEEMTDYSYSNFFGIPYDREEKELDMVMSSIFD